MKLKKLNKALMMAGLVAGTTLTASVEAVILSDDGHGEVLLYPFYTVQGPRTAVRTTLVTLVNHTGQYKAVKVRFHEAHNSRDALDFNLYLSPYDVWTGSIYRPADGIATLKTTDKSCTLPTSIMVNENKFSTLAYSQASNNDGGNQDALRTNEGYVEIIEMGVIDPNGPILTTGSTTYGNVTFGDAIKHKAGVPGQKSDSTLVNGVPKGCLDLQMAATSANGNWRAPVAGGDLDNAHRFVSQPTGGLSGTGMIVQPVLGTVAAYNATALKNFYDVAPKSACDNTITTAGAFYTTGAGNNAMYCETNGMPFAASTTNRAFDDLHSFKDLDTTTANARSIQTYPNLAMAYPQISSLVKPDTTGGELHVLEWSHNELVTSGVTRSSNNELFAAIRDLDNDVNAVVAGSTFATGAGLLCGGIDGVASAQATNICGNARPVSAVIAAKNLMNEYVLEKNAAAGINFKTDIVVTFPTKWYFTDNGLFEGGVVKDGVNGATVNIEGIDLYPFTSQFVSTTASGQRDKACEKFTGFAQNSLFDREENTLRPQDGVLVPSPAINVVTPDNYFCHESNVITLNKGDLLSSRIANGLDATVANAADGTNSFNIDLPAGFESGWFNIGFDQYVRSTTTGPVQSGALNTVFQVSPGVRVNGLPAIGFVMQGLVDGAKGFEGNFTAATEHKRIVDFQ